MGTGAIRENEPLKAVAHGLVLGAIAIPLAYNIFIRKWKNVVIYGALTAFEVYNIADHIRDARRGCR